MSSWTAYSPSFPPSPARPRPPRVNERTTTNKTTPFFGRPGVDTHTTTLGYFGSARPHPLFSLVLLLLFALHSSPDAHPSTDERLPTACSNYLGHKARQPNTCSVRVRSRKTPNDQLHAGLLAAQQTDEQTDGTHSTRRVSNDPHSGGWSSAFWLRRQIGTVSLRTRDPDVFRSTRIYSPQFDASVRRSFFSSSDYLSLRLRFCIRSVIPRGCRLRCRSSVRPSVCRPPSHAVRGNVSLFALVLRLLLFLVGGRFALLFFAALCVAFLCSAPLVVC